MPEATEVLSVPQAYGILDNAIRYGIYMTRVNILGCPFVIRALPEAEFNFLRSRVEGLGYYAAMNTIAAACLVSVAGINVLPIACTAPEELWPLLDAMPRGVSRILAEKHIDIRNRLYKASEYWEGFCHSNHSRRLWSTRDLDPYTSKFSGVHGQDLTSPYDIMTYWVLYNKAVDKRQASDEAHSLALIAASGSNPKGVKQVLDKKSKETEHRETERKVIVLSGTRDKVVDDQARARDGWAGNLDTSEQLLGEFERMAKGEKDKHDLFIEWFRNNERRKKLEEQEEKRLRAALAAKHRADMAQTQGQTTVLGVSNALMMAHVTGQKSISDIAKESSQDKILIRRPSRRRG